ncbi:hypothetical protein [Halostagnicola sp. A56]|uniref:hypothetical protein n=1 Tax=Halostagnicola sp. A56 TaxID=1495067 RepID=UPI0012E15039|nr:hypothetical protein [Halostagnicola sp. A56]
MTENSYLTDGGTEAGVDQSEKLGIDGESLAWRKEFTRFDESDRKRLEEISSVIRYRL